MMIKHIFSWSSATGSTLLFIVLLSERVFQKLAFFLLHNAGLGVVSYKLAKQ